MKNISLTSILSSVFILVISHACFAKVTPEDASRLGSELTPLGAEPHKNQEGTISAWNTALVDISSIGFKEGGHYADPFKNDTILFTIDQTNYKNYEAKLSPGQRKMIETYPSYRINVYPTRRPITYPPHILDTITHNAIHAELIEDGTGVKGFKGVVPFPIPQSGIEVMWNHITRYRGGSFERVFARVNPTSANNYSIIKTVEQYSRRFALQDYAPEKDEGVMFYFKQRTVAPARLSGNIALVQETLNQVKDPRRSWVYNAGQRRVRRAPQLSYDGPSANSSGLITIDNIDMFNGAPDRYDWSLEGKLELYVPYNSYQLDSKKINLQGYYTRQPHKPRSHSI